MASWFLVKGLFSGACVLHYLRSNGEVEETLNLIVDSNTSFFSYFGDRIFLGMPKYLLA